MAINTWRSPENEAYIRTRKAIRAESQRIAKENQRRKESEELWAWYANDYEVAESFEAQERAREAVSQRELQADIDTTLLLLEIEKALNN